MNGLQSRQETAETCTLTVNHILSLHRVLAELLQVLLIHRQAPGLRLQVLGVTLQVGPERSELGV